MIEGQSFKNIVDALSLVPLIASVYQVYLRSPRIIKSEIEVINALLALKSSSIIELPVGTHDVTPKEATQNYTISVVDQGGSDNIGMLQITHPSGANPVIFESDTVLGSSIKRDNSGKPMMLGPVETVEIITEVGQDKNLRVFGALLYRPKGRPVFPK